MSAKAAIVNDAMVDGEDDESSCSDAAQQRSASAWVTGWAGPCSSESELCIGHEPSSVQQAIRASGVDIQPAQTLAWPTMNASVKMTADSRWLKLSTYQGCGTEFSLSNRLVSRYPLNSAAAIWDRPAS